MTSTPARRQSPGQALAERLRPTLGNRDWLERHRETLRVLFPPSWSRINDPDVQVRMGISLTMLGVEWHEPGELQLIIHWLHRLGMVELEPFVTPRGQQVLMVRRRRKG